jgi:crotonobetainyl-CoA:carnitine CoA-transferase CaiB-like acyl-CoA transferase
MIDHPELGRELRYPGTVAGDGEAPHFSFSRRAPRLGEHTDEVLRATGLDGARIASLRNRSLI